MTLDRIVIDGQKRLIISENILTGRPLLVINTSLYLEMMKTSYEESKKIAYQIGLAVAKALSEVKFPLHHVDITIYYNPSAKVHLDVATRKVTISNDLLQHLRDPLTLNAHDSNSIHHYNASITNRAAATTNHSVQQSSDNYNVYEFENNEKAVHDVGQQRTHAIDYVAAATVATAILAAYIIRRYI